MKLSNKTYDTLKWIAQIVLPAVATFYTTIAEIWKLPFIVEIPATIVAIDTLLGVLLGISASKYKKNKEK